MLSSVGLLLVSGLLTSGLAAPLAPTTNRGAAQLSKRVDFPPAGKVCLTLGSDGTRNGGACGPVNTDGLPGVAIPMSIFDNYTPANGGTPNPNLNTLCGTQIRLTNGDNGNEIIAVVTDRNTAPPAGQSCSDNQGSYGPVSIDVDPAGWAQLGGTQERNGIPGADPSQLAVLSYEFLGLL